MSAVGYYHFLEESCGLGPAGSHLAHGAIIGGGVYALGEFADIEWCKVWWAPLVGTLVGTIGSVAVKALVMDDVKSYELFEKKVTRAIKGNPKWSEKGFIAEDGAFQRAVDVEVEAIMAKARALPAPTKDTGT
jgi:hypothetical protein